MLEDVERGYVSAEAAERDYGVVIKDGEIDARATAARRGKMAAQATGHFFDFGPERDQFEKTWSPAAYDELTRILAALPIHWRFFVKGKVFELIGETDGPSGPVRVRSAFAAARARFPAIPEETHG